VDLQICGFAGKDGPRDPPGKEGCIPMCLRYTTLPLRDVRAEGTPRVPDLLWPAGRRVADVARVGDCAGDEIHEGYQRFLVEMERCRTRAPRQDA
jgi:hypothetical protein